MRISIDTATDSFEDALAAVHAAYGVPLATAVVTPHDTEEPGEIKGDDTEEPGDSEGDDYLPGKWNRKKIREVAKWVAPVNAAIALRYMAVHAPAVDIDEVVAHLAQVTGNEGLRGQDMGGTMSSVGFAKNSINPSGSGIYDTDYKNRKYRMDKNIAKVLLEELDALKS